MYSNKVASTIVKLWLKEIDNGSRTTRWSFTKYEIVLTLLFLLKVKQVRRQDSVTEGYKKNFWGARKLYFLEFESMDQRNRCSTRNSTKSGVKTKNKNKNGLHLKNMRISSNSGHQRKKRAKFHEF